MENIEQIKLLKERRSIRKYKDEIVGKDVLANIIDAARFAPSWANYQVARYTFVTSTDKIEKIISDAALNFSYNINTLKLAKNVAVLSYVKGKSGKLDVEKDEFATSKEGQWEVFDAGIACQTFCLAAHAYGVGTCIMGVFDDKKVAEIANLPADETVAAIIVYGYPKDCEVPPTSRKEVEQIIRFVD